MSFILKQGIAVGIAIQNRRKQQFFQCYKAVTAATTMLQSQL